MSGGDVVLVTGAAGMVGGFAVQLARGRGARVVAAVRERESGEARRLGAETVVDTGTELEAAVRRQWQAGVDACVDTAGLRVSGLGVCPRRRRVRDFGHHSSRGRARRCAGNLSPDCGGAARC